MPRIDPYTARETDFRPTETGIDALAQGARRIGAFASQTAGALEDTGNRIGRGVREAGQAAVAYFEHREVSQGAATFAQINDALVKQWNDTAKNADPNDPAVAQTFRDKVLEPQLEKFRDGFNTEGGQRWAEAHVEHFRQHMFEKTSADMSTLAGQAAAVNHRQVVNGLSNTVRGDPTSLDYALKSLDSSTGALVDSSPNLTGARAGQVKMELMQTGKEQIVKAAALGYIEKTGEMPKWATDPKYAPYINGQELQMFAKAAKAQQRADLLTQKQLETYARQQADIKVHQQANDLFTRNVSIDPTSGRPIISPDYFKQVLDLAKNNPQAPSASTTARTLLDWGEHQQNLKDVPTRSDPAVRQDFIDRMFSADKPTTDIEIMRAEIDKKLTTQDANQMRQLVQLLAKEPLQGPVWHDTMAAVKGELILSGIGIPGKDIAGEANYAKFAQTFIPQYLAKQRAGTLEPNALDVKDPNSMISKAMAPFKRTLSDRMRDYMSVLGGVPGAPAGGFTPPPSWQWSPSRQKYRDPANGKVYDVTGKEVK